MEGIAPLMVEAQQSMKQGTREALGIQKKLEIQEEKKKTLETKENPENTEDPETHGTQETQETLIIMSQVQDPAHRGRRQQEINQEEDTGKNTETHLGTVIKTEEEQIEAIAEKEEEIWMLTETTGQAMVGGDAEKVARSPWVMGGLL